MATLYIRINIKSSRTLENRLKAQNKINKQVNKSVTLDRVQCIALYFKDE